MKQFASRHPEALGMFVGLVDAIPRAVAAWVYAPSEATLHGVVLLGNVHHVNGIRALGLDTMAWFAIGAAILAVLYAALRTAGRVLALDNAAFAAARGLLGVVGGVLLLNVVESWWTGKVTNWIGIAYGTRFTAFNFGDVVVFLGTGAVLPVFAVAVALHYLQSRPATAG